MSYIKFENIVREYKTGDVTIRALDNTNFEIEKGELSVCSNGSNQFPS